MMTTLNSQPILPRVVAVSGTIKKLQNAAIVYHRRVTGMMLNVVLAQEGEGLLLKDNGPG